MDFKVIESEIETAMAADEKYERENSAKFRAVEQKVATYDEFRDIVRASHLRPLDKKEKLVDPELSRKNVIWNTAVTQTSREDNNMLKFGLSAKRKHFTEK